MILLLLCNSYVILYQIELWRERHELLVICRNIKIMVLKNCKKLQIRVAYLLRVERFSVDMLIVFHFKTNLNSADQNVVSLFRDRSED